MAKGDAIPKSLAAGWRVGKTLQGAGIGALTGGALGGITAGKDEDKWQAAKRGAGLGAIAGGGVGLYKGNKDVKLFNRVVENYKKPGRFKRFFNLNAERDAAIKAFEKAKTGSIHPVAISAFKDELEKIAYLKSMGIGAGIGALGGGAVGAAADDKNRFRGFVGGALGGAALGAGAGAGYKALASGGGAATKKGLDAAKGEYTPVHEMIGRARLRRGLHPSSPTGTNTHGGGI